jgi:copper resistance protein C
MVSASALSDLIATRFTVGVRARSATVRGGDILSVAARRSLRILTHMSTRRSPAGPIALAVVLLVPSAALAVRHLKLVRSEPAAGSRVSAPPAAVKLWFSQETQLAVTKVTLVPTSGPSVVLSGLSREPGKDAPVVAPISSALPPGAWIVRWRTVARDGHPIKGDIPFTVVAPASR